MGGYFSTIGEYSLNGQNGFISWYSNVLSNCTYITDTIQSGKINIIKLDSINYIISGTFEFKVGISNCDTIKITQGRFDLKYAN